MSTTSLYIVRVSLKHTHVEEQKLISKISNGRVEAAADLYYITILTALLMRNTTRINEHSPNRKKPSILNSKVTARKKKKKKIISGFQLFLLEFRFFKINCSATRWNCLDGLEEKINSPGKRPLAAVWSRNLLFGMQRMLCNHGHTIKRASLSSVAVNDDLLHDRDENGPRYRGTTHRFIRLTLSLSFSTSHGKTKYRVPSHKVYE